MTAQVFTLNNGASAGEKGKHQAKQVLHSSALPGQPVSGGPLQAPAVQAWFLLVHSLANPLHALR